MTSVLHDAGIGVDVATSWTVATVPADRARGRRGAAYGASELRHRQRSRRQYPLRCVSRWTARIRSS